MYNKMTICAVVLLGIFLSSCGQQVCVLGMGSCEVPKSKDLATQSDKKLALKIAKSAIIVDEKVTLTVEGGILPYKFEISQGTGTLSNSGTYSKDTTSIYTAPATISSKEGIIVQFRVTDSGNPKSATSITSVTVTEK